ncbi:MAG: hypothetical protein EOO20_26530, partial [Chryseobacterium sp.]
YFYNLAQLAFPIRDNHFAFFQLPVTTPFRTKESIDSFVQTVTFKEYPAVNLSIDSLKAALSAKESSSVEGVYYYDKFYTLGVFKAGEKEYTGIILSSELKFWTPGQVAFRLYESRPNTFKGVYAHPYTKHFMLHNIEKYYDQTLAGANFFASFSTATYTKRKDVKDYVNSTRKTPEFEFRQIDENIQYIRVGTFQRNKVTSKKSADFYDSIQPLLKSDNIIFDLRNNMGGASYEAKKYVKMIKRFARHHKVYLLLNFTTLSQAEIVTIRLKNKRNIITVGQTTKGMVAYGQNMSNREYLPSKRFVVETTDMKDGNFQEYEDVGIEPKIWLTSDADWIEQVKAIIAAR